MTGCQVLSKVELPCALPLIFSGLRTAPAGHRDRDDRGRRPRRAGPLPHRRPGVRDYPQMAGGAVLVAVLALVVDLVLAVVQRYAVSPGLTGRIRSAAGMPPESETELETCPSRRKPADLTPEQTVGRRP